MFSKSVRKGVIVIAALLAASLLMTRLANTPTEASSEGARQADAARWEGWAQYYAASSARGRSITADTARWTAIAAHYTASESRLRALAADASRWSALAAAYAAPEARQRAVAADAARWSGLAEYYRAQVSK